MPVLKNPKHERFAQELAKGKSAAEAYQTAGYSPNPGNCIRLKGNESVSNRVAEIVGRVAKRAEVTIEDIARQLDEDRALAHEVKQAGAAVSASSVKAKLFGLIREKHEHTGANGGPIKHDLSGLSDDNLAQLEAILGSNPHARRSSGGNKEQAD